MSTKPKLNGSVDLLASAMRQVFSEAVSDAVKPIHKDMQGIRKDVQDVRKDMVSMEGRLNDRIDTTNKNVQAQLATQEEKISALISNR